MSADLFSIGRSSLRTAKKSLSTTSHNIANANTEGYSRQIARAETNSPISNGDQVYGTGVRIASVKRAHDKILERKYINSLSENNFDKERTLQLSQVEEIFNEMNSDGMNKIMNRFFNSFRELSNQPENETVRNLVRDNAQIVVKDFQRISTAITDAKDLMETKVQYAVNDLNVQLHSIAKLNKEIARLENMGGESGDLRDQRDLAVKTIAEFGKVNVYEDKKGSYVVAFEGVGALVAGGIVNELSAGKIGEDAIGSYRDEGRTEIFFKDRPDFAITDKIRGGSLRAIIQTRNNEVKSLREKLDAMAHGLVHATNAIHRRGYTNQEIPTDANGNIIPNSGMKVTGLNFFKEPLNFDRASQYLSLSDEIKEDVNNIATGLAPNSPGDNRVAIAISKLQHERILGEGTKTLEESYLEAVSSVGLAAGKSKINEEQSGGILAQAKSLKERNSGVSIDEETTNMVKYQQAYKASAKVITAADEMFDSVLGLVR